MTKLIRSLVLAAALCWSAIASAANDFPAVPLDGLGYTGSTAIYVVVTSTDPATNGQAWNTTGTPQLTARTSTRANFALAMTDLGGGSFSLTTPALPAGNYTFGIFVSAGGSAATAAQTDVYLNNGRLYWTGSRWFQSLPDAVLFNQPTYKGF